MLEKILRFLEKYVIPKRLYRLGQPIYHFMLAFLGNFIYGAPSKRMFVVGVTGTKGKTTTANLIAQILNGVGFKAGKITSVVFGIGEKEWKNDTKHAMPGRFQLQKLLLQMTKAGCRYAVVETSSEGILQFRHRFIDYKAAVFTNLSPEHIERHGSFQSYRAAKLKLFEKIARKKDGIGIFNLDDENAEYFLGPSVKNKIGYGMKFLNPKPELQMKFQISNVELSTRGTEFKFNGEKFVMPLIGEFNVYNAAAAISFALSQNIPAQKIREVLKRAKPVPGRLEVVDSGQDFTVIVDYAHEPASLEAAYKAVKLFNPRRIIGLLGAQGGGRDKWKRAAMAKIAEKYCDEIIFTNEDPYDEEPKRIIDDLAAAIGGRAGITNHKSRIYKITDRREAIQKAVSLAEKGDAVILTGKGGEVWMCLKNDKKIPWNEKKIVEEALKARISSTE